MSQVSQSLPARLRTWRDNADGHEQDMFFLMEVQLLQPHLELYEGLNQLQGVPSCEREEPGKGRGIHPT